MKKNFESFIKNLSDVDICPNIYTTYHGIPLGVCFSSLEGKYVYTLYPFYLKKGFFSDKLLYTEDKSWLEKYIDSYAIVGEDFLSLYLSPNLFYDPYEQLPAFEKVLSKFGYFSSNWMPAGINFYVHTEEFSEISKNFLYKINKQDKHIYVFIVKNGYYQFFKISDVKSYLSFLNCLYQYGFLVVDEFISKTSYLYKNENIEMFLTKSGAR